MQFPSSNRLFNPFFAQALIAGKDAGAPVGAL
jgi:hypothetical protein